MTSPSLTLMPSLRTVFSPRLLVSSTLSFCAFCTTADCSQAILALGTPLLWWSACCALLYLLYRWALRRDWRAGALLCAVGAGYLPWFLYQDRTIFSFYAVVFVPYLCLAVVMMLGALLGPPGSGEKRRIRELTRTEKQLLASWMLTGRRTFTKVEQLWAEFNQLPQPERDEVRETLSASL